MSKQTLALFHFDGCKTQWQDWQYILDKLLLKPAPTVKSGFSDKQAKTKKKTSNLLPKVFIKLNMKLSLEKINK